MDTLSALALTVMEMAMDDLSGLAAREQGHAERWVRKRAVEGDTVRLAIPNYQGGSNGTGTPRKAVSVEDDGFVFTDNNMAIGPRDYEVLEVSRPTPKAIREVIDFAHELTEHRSRAHENAQRKTSAHDDLAGAWQIAGMRYLVGELRAVYLDAHTPDMPSQDVAPASPTTQDQIAATCDAVKAMLLAKNRRYGNSALEPVRIFSRATPVEQILVRLDDKLSRLRSAQLDEDEDVIDDLIGYLVLLKMARAR